ncbi:MAG: pyridoxal phosphate-dependent aminotransferase [Thermicanus sp.]|nr:pyridoxal phosphate-dependent aminotransferase [Thermicanus sp.]
MQVKLADRVLTLSPSPTLAITAKAKQLKAEGHDVISLGAGEPDFNTPAHIIEAAYEAMKEGKTKYTPSGGIPELKKAIQKKLAKDQGLEYGLNEIHVAAGAKHALYNFFQVVVNPGDEVLIPIPYWVSYPEQVKLAGGVPVYIEGKEENGFKVTADQVRQAITERTKAIIINTPSNPTGAVYTREELEGIGRVAIEHHLWIVSDEIYEKLIYEGEHVSIASLGPEFKEHTILFNGVSKPYSMTGWRIGYAAGNKEVLNAMTDLSSQSVSNPTSISQYASIAALEGDQTPLLEMKAAFKERRDRLIPLLRQIPGFRCDVPHGAFYIYLNVAEAMKKADFTDVDAWSEALLEKEKVAVVSGTGFGTKNHIRISYATSMADLEEAARRMYRFVTGG